MKTLLALLATLTVVIAASGPAAAQCYDTCAPHRHGFYGYSSAGHGFGGGYGRGMRGPVRPFQGLVNPRYLQPAVEYIVVAPVDSIETQPQVYLPREIRERKQAEMEIASDSELLQQPREQEPGRDRPSDYKSPATEARRTPAPRPQRPKVPQPELVAARSKTSPGPNATTRARRMTSAAADDYVARSAAALERLRTQRTNLAPQVAAEGSAVATTATANTRQN